MPLCFSAVSVYLSDNPYHLLDKLQIFSLVSMLFGNYCRYLTWGKKLYNWQSNCVTLWLCNWWIYYAYEEWRSLAQLVSLQWALHGILATVMNTQKSFSLCLLSMNLSPYISFGKFCLACFLAPSLFHVLRMSETVWAFCRNVGY